MAVSCCWTLLVLLAASLGIADGRCSEQVIDTAIESYGLCHYSSVPKLIHKKEKDVETKCREVIKETKTCLERPSGQLNKCLSPEQAEGFESFKRSELAQTKYYCHENGKNLKIFWDHDGLICLNKSSVDNCSIPKPTIVFRPSLKNCRGRREYLECYKANIHPRLCSDYARKFLISGIEALLSESSCSGYLSQAPVVAAESAFVCILVLLMYIVTY